MKVIGFANKYYTLWEVTEETRPLGNGHNYVVTHFNYIKNISFSKDVVLAKYPNVTMDESLRGKTVSFKTEKEVWDNVDTFRFGKYKYQKINDVDDIGYIVWYWDQVNDKHKEFVGNVLKGYGYKIRKWTGESTSGEYLMDPVALMNEQENLAKVNYIYNKCVLGDTLEFTPTHNIDFFGEFRDGDIIYKFEYFKVTDYQGYEYGLPLDNKGKAKRIKNKNIKITDYSYKLNGNILTVIINKFEILK